MVQLKYEPNDGYVNDIAESCISRCCTVYVGVEKAALFEWMSRYIGGSNLPEMHAA